MGITLLALTGALNTSDPEQIMPAILQRYLPDGVRGIVIAGLLAAFMSTFSSTVNAGASFVVRDLWQPIFRPDATSEELVDEFANSENRLPAFLSLYTRGEAALPAIRDGLGHANWQVRKWCAMFIDNFADAETLHALVPLLRDPKAAVRTSVPYPR